MEQRDNLKIVVDAGHGGWDNGASFNGRLEKNDNLRLALEVQKQMQAQNIDVLMTRSTDVFVELKDRADMANEADADLFISLHRNSYPEQTPWTNGVSNYIYLTAPEITTGKAASLVLEEVVAVGVQSDKGVLRGNYYVLRKTKMPSMLLEMGYINNEEDNRLFDQNLVPYAQAVTRGALRYFNLPYSDEISPPPPVAPEKPATGPVLPPSPVGPIPYQPVQRGDNITQAQQALNATFGSGIAEDGILGPKTKAAAVRALQQTTNDSCNTNLSVDGVLGPITKTAIPEYEEGDRGNGVKLIQLLLLARGYSPGNIDGIYGPKTKAAVQMFQRDNYLQPDGIAGPLTITALLNW